MLDSSYAIGQYSGKRLLRINNTQVSVPIHSSLCRTVPFSYSLHTHWIYKTVQGTNLSIHELHSVMKFGQRTRCIQVKKTAWWNDSIFTSNKNIESSLTILTSTGVIKLKTYQYFLLTEIPPTPHPEVWEEMKINDLQSS